MTGSGSDQNEDRAFVETDARETKMSFHHRGVPLYVAVVWVLFLASYVVYMIYYALPDLSAWGSL